MSGSSAFAMARYKYVLDPKEARISDPNRDYEPPNPLCCNVCENVEYQRCDLSLDFVSRYSVLTEFSVDGTPSFSESKPASFDMMHVSFPFQVQME